MNDEGVNSRVGVGGLDGERSVLRDKDGLLPARGSFLDE
jgi:hypothetical protein